MLEISYQDSRYVVVSKPAGMLVHRSPIDKYATENCQELLSDQLGRAVYPCHRLDKATSGVLLFALDKDSLRHANREFAKGRVGKCYQALVRGWLSGAGEVDHPLSPIDEVGQRRAAGGKQAAITEFSGLCAYEIDIPLGGFPSVRYSLQELRPRTGRRHQLRRHLKHLSHPIIGDTRYGDGRHNRIFRQFFNCHRLLLFAQSLRLRNVDNEVIIDISIPPDGSFSEVLEQLEGFRTKA